MAGERRQSRAHGPFQGQFVDRIVRPLREVDWKLPPASNRGTIIAAWLDPTHTFVIVSVRDANGVNYEMKLHDLILE